MLRVLQSPAQNAAARAELERDGLSLVRRGALAGLGRRFGLEAFAYGDLRKSWDVLSTARFLEQHVGREQPVVDFGAWHSEITGVLARLGYSDLHAIDLNPRLTSAPFADRIRYRVGDYLASGFPDGSFAAITSISAIEHGHSVDRLLAEVTRLLRPGGYFVASTDYWPTKVDTTGVQFFGMDWTIFSAGEMAALIEAAGRRGLVPAGSLEYDAPQPSIRFAGREYTFAWLALQKRAAAA